jgi:hypothetical protein
LFEELGTEQAIALLERWSARTQRPSRVLELSERARPA